MSNMTQRSFNTKANRGKSSMSPGFLLPFVNPCGSILLSVLLALISIPSLRSSHFFFLLVLKGFDIANRDESKGEGRFYKRKKKKKRNQA
ncbi:Uncharacterized protein TCM_033296 [Theobroma cacao]|uniref:Transmembrane protein n=1 Tax=Theobroma cacao TaxID=3641 RepID=A0A061F9P7_THECC|nr:Uncharacterized protein TCM_033296 [Theobroma cacao]